MSLMKIFDTAGSGMSAQSLRLNTVASNLANADSTSSSADSAYKAKELLFAPQADTSDPLNNDSESAANNGVRMVGITESNQPVQSTYQPGNPMADQNGYVYGTNVNPVDELVNMISASRSYQNNVEVMNTAKQLMIKTIDLGGNS